MRWTTIYALLEPAQDEIRYIGKADRPQERLSHHLFESARARHRRANWIRSLKGALPRIVIIAEVPYEEWQFWEYHFIKYFRECGFDLVNTTPGGDGVGSGTQHPNFGKPGARLGQVVSKTTRAKMSAAKKGKKQSPEQIGARFTEAGRIKMRLAKLGKKLPLTTRIKIGAANKGKLISASHRQAISLAQRGREKSAAEIQKRKETMKGKALQCAA